MMTDLNFNAQINTAVNNAMAKGTEGASFVIAAGIMGSFFRPFNASPFAGAQLGNVFGLALGTATAELMAGAMAGASNLASLAQPQAQWTASLGQNGTGNIDLGDGYTLSLNQNNSEIDIHDASNGQTTQIWGDPHVNVNGNHAFDFAGTTTFELKNGTKVTINTEQWKGNPNAYTASNVVITKGSNAIVVNNISQNKDGALSITESNNGYALDAANRDGYVLSESNAGWVSEHTGQVATQQDMNATEAGGAYAPGSNTMSLGEYGKMLGNFLSFGITQSFAALSFEAGIESKIEHAVEKATNRAMHQLFATV